MLLGKAGERIGILARRAGGVSELLTVELEKEGCAQNVSKQMMFLSVRGRGSYTDIRQARAGH
eukprot:7866712-Lingulodinium_polyedra.AAC.1